MIDLEWRFNKKDKRWILWWRQSKMPSDENPFEVNWGEWKEVPSNPENPFDKRKKKGDK